MLQPAQKFIPTASEALAGNLPPLLVAAEQLALQFHSGAHGRRRVGRGESFWQFRPYQAGDTVRQIDWRQSARSSNNQLFVREREWEAAQTIYCWADQSGSMHYRSAPNLPSKTERAHLLLLALNYLLLQAGEYIVWQLPDAVSARGKSGWAKLGNALFPLSPSPLNTPPAQPLARYAHRMIASDFLADAAQWQQQIQQSYALHMRGILLHIADPAEIAAPLQGRVRITGCEAEADLLLPKGQNLRAAYQQRWVEHQRSLQNLAASAGWFYLFHQSDHAPLPALLQLYNLLVDAPQ